MLLKLNVLEASKPLYINHDIRYAFGKEFKSNIVNHSVKNIDTNGGICFGLKGILYHSAVLQLTRVDQKELTSAAMHAVIVISNENQRCSFESGVSRSEQSNDGKLIYCNAM